VLHDQYAWSLGLFAYASMTDLLDGWIARQWNRQTVVGTVIDPMADKALMTVLTVTLAVKGALPGTSFERPARIESYELTLGRNSSLACGNHPWSRCGIGNIGHLLSLDLPAAAKDIYSLLGLFSAFCGGAPNANQ
jgi:CDP-alcohol phosphatidyltransferase